LTECCQGGTIARRQDAVNAAGHTPEGEALTRLLVEVIRLGELFTQTGESLARPEGQTLARWLVLGTLADGPQPVAEIARRLRLTRQSVQRVADLLERDGLIAYGDNPRHRRAKLARLTSEGGRVLARIDAAQRAWANRHGAEVGLADAEQAAALLERIRGALIRPDSHG
jgi:DNA-binding MarR family transcriptional regulator